MEAHLELEDIVAEDIDKTQKGEREKRHAFLRKWKSMNGSKATYKQLIAALLKIKCKDEAEKVQEMEAKKVQEMLKALQPQQPTQDSVTCASPTPSTSKNTYPPVGSHVRLLPGHMSL